MPFDGTNFGDRNPLIAKLDRVVELLRTEDQWCQGRLSTADGRRCLLGALDEVQARTLLAPHIRLAIREVTGRPYQRIDRFNDHHHTSHRLVLTVLSQTRGNILIGKRVPIWDAAVAERVRAFYAALARLRRP